MIKNYLKTAWRNLTRNKLSSFINISGLAIGMTCVVLILFYVQDELKYDRSFDGADRIYQVNMENTDSDGTNLTGNTAPAVGPAMVNDIPEIETYVRIQRPGDITVRYEQEKESLNYFTERRILAVDSNCLSVFTYSMLEGDRGSCLNQPNSIVITRKTAEKYFGTNYRDALGKILLYGNEKKPMEVTAVLENPPSQSSLVFDILVPISINPDVKRRSWNWWWLQVNTYVKLRDNVVTGKSTIEKIEAKFPELAKKHAFETNPITYEEFAKKGYSVTFHLLPLTDVHLKAAGLGTPARLTTLGDIKYIRVFGAIAFVIIILACVNFMNLSTAQAAKRAKEIGIRKVLGSQKKQLIRQFLAEAFLFSTISALVSVVLVLLLLKPFNEVAGKAFTINLFFSHNLWLVIPGLALITGLLAGSYPAFYLTSFKPVIVLKGMKLFRAGPGDLFVRNGLVVFQFTISTALIIATIIIFEQLRFARNKDLGFDKENVVVIANSERLKEREESFRQELTKHPSVVSASITTGIPITENFGDVYVPLPVSDNDQVVKEIGLSSFLVDYDFVPALGIDIVKGRNFSKDFSDSASVIINEKAASEMGWKDPIGATLDYPGNSQSFKVIGVAKDFNIGSLRTAVVPFALFHSSSRTYGLAHSYIVVRLKPGNVREHLRQIESEWKGFVASTPFDYSFLDNDLDALYKSEKRMSRLFVIFTVLSIFIACLGLFGLATYTAERRIKEIGIRKVLGATVHGIVRLLSKEFAKLVLLASVIAFPLAWWFMNDWLKDFAYRINISWWVFIAAGVIVLIIALMTVSFQAIKAAIANPVAALRSE